MFDKTNRASALFAAFVMASLTIGGAAMAQQGQGQAQSPSFTESEVESFANVVQEIQSIRKEYQPKMKEAGDKQQKTALQKEAQQEMIGAIKEEGLTVKKYSQISKAIPNNPELSNRIKKHMGSAE